MDEVETQRIAEEAARLAATIVVFTRALELMQKSVTTNGPIVLQPEHCRAMIEMLNVLRQGKTDG